MVYASPNPTAACSGNSILANFHRGLGRVFGDESSLRFDTLYGIALSNIYYGEGSTTGPTARIGAYVYCAYPGYSVLLFILIVFAFILAARLIGRICLHSGKLFSALGASILSSIFFALQDYNGMMSALSMLFVLAILLVWRRILLTICTKRLV